MEVKTDAVRREILKGILDRHSGSGKKVLIRIAKEKGVYKQFVDDAEVWDLIQKFAEFHNIPITEPEEKEFLEPMFIDKEKQTGEWENLPEDNEENNFLVLLEKEHARLSKKLLAINKIMELYKKN